MSDEQKQDTAVITSPKNTSVAKPASGIKDLLAGEAFRKQVSLCLPKHLSPERFCRIAITATTRVPKLAECSQASFFGALLTLSQYGLEPDGRHAHLIPYGKECTLIIDYKGLVSLIYRNSNVANVYASVVCENDVFVWDSGQVKQHVIDFKGKRGAMYCAYAIVRMKDGSELADCMSKDEIDAIRARSKAANTGPWKSDYNEMAKKTVLRRLSKLVPLPSEVQDAVYGDDDGPVNLKKGGTVIDIPPELITDGSDKEQPTVETVEKGKAKGVDAVMAAVDSAVGDSTGLTDEEKRKIEASERGELI